MHVHHGHHGKPTGWIEVVCGPMFSGKTEELIRRLRLARIARQRVEIFKPAVDTRYAQRHIVSHNDQKFTCTPITRAEQILEMMDDSTRVVGIDEAQFFDDAIVQVCEKIANRGLRVIVAGLDQDYRGEPFGPMPQLLALAESILKLKAVCTTCGGWASKSQRLSPETTRVALGATEKYEARCRACYEGDLAAQKEEPLFTVVGEDHADRDNVLPLTKTPQPDTP